MSDNIYYVKLNPARSQRCHQRLSATHLPPPWRPAGGLPLPKPSHGDETAGSWSSSCCTNSEIPAAPSAARNDIRACIRRRDVFHPAAPPQQRYCYQQTSVTNTRQPTLSVIVSEAKQSRLFRSFRGKIFFLLRSVGGVLRTNMLEHVTARRSCRVLQGWPSLRVGA